jgi:hypothetical protein
LYRNNGNSTFTDVASATNSGFAGSLTSVAPADFDNDGDLDLYISSNSANALFKNDLNPYNNTYLMIKALSATQRWNQSGIKMNLKTTTGGTFVATRTLDGGSGYMSQSAVAVPFYNLNPATSYDIQIFWSDGTNTTHTLGTPDGSTKRICKGVGLC